MAEGSSSSSSDKKPASSSNRGIRTLADLNRTASDSDRPVEYYTGGEKSGMLVQDPDKKNSDVDDLFERARQHGATEEAPPEENPSLISRAFTGVARLLTGGSAAPQPPQVAVHTVTFWRNGFTVDDGPLRSLDDPENQSFLNSIRMNNVPPELRPADRRTEVDLRLVRRDEDCPVRIPPVRAFQGTGRTLGSSSSSAAEEPSSSSTASVATNSSNGGFSVDESKPVTSIQIRLSDGTRMVARFNHHHTVADIRDFINYSWRGTAPNYQLQVMGFPPRMLNDPEETIEKAGLMNSVVIQKL